MKKFRKFSSAVLAAILVINVTGTILAGTTVDLGTAEPFAILSGTPNITDSPTSSIIGDVGLYPGPGSGIGLVCAQVNGTIYARDGTGDICFTVNDPLLLGAKNDLTAAFIDASGRGPVTTIPTELGGNTLTEGVYDSVSNTFGITAGAGTLILDGLGDPSSVFIFEMDEDGTGLIVGPGSVITLVNQAQACNVFWRVDTATIDTTAVFKGNILALNSITVANAANIEGRLLARNGSVTLINDTVTAAFCAALTPEDEDTPGLPNAGLTSGKSAPWSEVIAVGGILLALSSLYLVRKNRVA